MSGKRFARNAAITLISILAAALLRALIDAYLHEAISYGTFYLAVIFTSLHCGLAWGLASAALSGVAAAFVVPPFGKLLITEPTDLTAMLLFLVVSCLIVWLSHRMREAQQHAERAAAERHDLLTREQAARSEAERANRAKDHFLAAVSHELRTPLQSILGWSEILRDGMLDAGEIRLAADSIQRGATMQTQLINDLLDLSRIVMGKLRLDARPVSLRDVVDAAVQTVTPAAIAKKVRLEVECDGVGAVLGDFDRLQQVAWNLLTNAIKFTPTGGVVRALLTHASDHVELVVRDNGEGIKTDFLPRLFNRFEQADGSRRREGLGLGLAIVRQLVELHGGQVAARSDGPGKGAEFRVVLPKHFPSAVDVDSPTSATPGNKAPIRDLAGSQVLVIDDDQEACQVLKALLAQYGIDVLAAESVAQAKKLLDVYTPDIITCDLDMPGEDGFDFIRDLRRRRSEGVAPLPAIALTACGGAIDRQRALESGFHAHLIKPVPPCELAAALAEVSGARRRPR